MIPYARELVGAVDVAGLVFGPLGAGMGSALARQFDTATEPLTTGVLQVAVPVLEGMVERMDRWDASLKARAAARQDEFQAKTERFHHSPANNNRRFGIAARFGAARGFLARSVGHR